MKQRGSMLLILIALVVLVLAAASPVLAAVSVAGFVVTDMVYSDKINGSYFPPRSGGATSSPLDTDKDRDNKQFIIAVPRTRVFVGWTDDAPGGIKLSGRVEGDFNTAEGNALTSNSRGFRLRVAFARADHPTGFFLIAGQYFGIVNNYPPDGDVAFLGKYGIDDVNGAVGGVNGVRQPQVRVGWKSTVMPGTVLVLEGNIEKQSVPNLGSASVDESQGEGQDLPLLGGRVTLNHPIFRVLAGVAYAKNKVTLTGGSQEDDTASMLFANAEVILKPVTLFGHFHTQKGLSRLTGGAGEFPTAFLVNNKVENVESDGFYAGVRFDVTATTRFDFIYGYHKADEIPGTFTGASLEKMQTWELNMIQRFWKNFQGGVAVRQNLVDAFNGDDGKETQFHVNIYYFF